MNALSIVNKVISLVSFKMHKSRQKALTACVKSLLNGSTATVTSIGRGINNKAFEKHRIKRADRLLSNTNLLHETPTIYAATCQLLCSHILRPVISVDWSDLDEHNGHFLLRAAISLKGRPITLYQEVHCNKTREKQATHRAFLHALRAVLPSQCHPIIVTDAGYKSPWFREVIALGWDIVGRVRRPHYYSSDSGHTWQCIHQLYAQATCRPKRFDNSQIVRSNPFACTLVLFKQKSKGRHARNTDGSLKRSGHSKKHAQGAKDPWLLATSLSSHRQLSKQVVGIYRQRMQIEEGFRDMKSTKFGLGYEQNKSIKKQRLTILILLTTLASLVAILLGMVLVSSNIHRRFQANTEIRSVLSFHYLGLRAIACRIRFTMRQWKAALKWYSSIVDSAWAGSTWN
ncbi:IS4 family transposase [Alteromonas hispanica]|uniref:IS4 family transposase n=1 Tax=Alteromonas hispanica TaxID=315421 RepID=A0A6L9MZX3_9ALTE|nr:IS4 family transposase [Alteromonas hispanica]NDW23280.1 IS4 family transposase [Alteromonas hispanica]